MSNHIVGESMNYLTKAVFEMHDQKEISKEAAHKIIKLACNVVDDCDGNRSEAFWSSIKHHCSCCFRAASIILLSFPGDGTLVSEISSIW